MHYPKLLNHSLWAVPLVCALATTGYSSPADACDPAFWYWDTVPQAGETYPANATPILKGYGAFEEVSATIDGVDASVSVNTDLSGFFEGVAVTLDPQPQPGQTVVITYPGEDDGCGMVPCATELSYTAGELDTTAPGAAAVDEVNVVRYASEEFDSCGGIHGGVAWWLHLQHTADAAGAPEYIQVRGYEPGNPQITVVSVSRAGGADRAKIGEELGFAEGLGDFPEGLCFDVEVFDMAGQTSEIAAGICDICHFRDGEPTDNGEPMWDETDIVPGGACGVGPGTDTDTGGETDGTGGETDATGGETDPTGGETDASATDGETDSDSDTGGQTEKGCGCTTTNDAPGAWLLAGLLAFGLRRRRA